MVKTSGKDSLYRRIYTAVAKVPRGRVVTYGQVARRVRGATPRVVGYAMAALPDELRGDSVSSRAFGRACGGDSRAESPGDRAGGLC